MDYSSFAFQQPLGSAGVHAYQDQQGPTEPMLPATINVHANATLYFEHALSHLEAGRRGAAWEAVEQGLGLIVLLKHSLLPQGGDPSQDLARVYDYLARRLDVSLSELSAEPVAIAWQTLQSLTTAWKSRRCPSELSLTGLAHAVRHGT